MRWLFQLLIVPILCLVAIAIPAVPAQAICLPYDIEILPKAGLPGTNVTVYGHNFALDKLVEISYDGTWMTKGRTDTIRGDFTITFTIPEGCKGYYQVLADVGYVKMDTYFNVKPGLAISPEEGPVGSNVTVRGAGFARKEADIELMYYLNDRYQTVAGNITANVTGSWETGFQIPPSPSGQHKIDAQGAESKHYEVSEATFRVTAEIGLDESSGIVGESVTMTGARFAAYEKGIRILFDGQAVATGIKANSKGEWQASFHVPDMPSGEYAISAEGDQTRNEDVGELSFKIRPEVVLSASEGHVGMDLSVAGRGFSANGTVVIRFAGTQVTTAGTDDKGSFEVSFAVPRDRYGDLPVTAEDAAGNDGTAVFVMESNHPNTPALISPASRGWLGFIGKVAPTFEWSPVSDDSGVSYSLQVATSDDFAATSIIASATNLTETSYTLPEALPQGTYYWIVQAVDRAENESDWTSARSFRVGFLPRWGLIVAIAVAAVVVLIFLIRALVRRRSIYYDRW
ncbi:MAG: Ig-like domain-containing protein [Dehalococcoidia bacterium]|nr:Ig-like domain-containing protein [Dehalococcoidia bacterium]